MQFAHARVRGSRFVLSALLTVVVPAGFAAGGEQEISVTIRAGEPKITTTVDGHEVSVEGFGYLLVPGKPALPSKIFAVAIPPGAEVVDVRYDAPKSVTLPGTYRVVPSSLRRVIGEENPVLYQRDKQKYDENFEFVYSRDDVYPAGSVEFVRSAGYRKYNLADVRVTPFGYRPLSGQLIFYPEITVHVTYAFSGAPVAAMIDDSPRIERMAQRIIVNHDDTADWYPREKAGTNRDQYDFVIITLDSLTFPVGSLAIWEQSKGRNTQTVTTSWIESNYPAGYDLAEKIRNFLRDKYPSEQWGIRDVLLVGDYDDVPMRRTWQDLGYGKPETDYYYAELSLPDSQSWDADGDHQWGENSDPIDFYAEVNVGRIPWSDPATVVSICQKSVAYEQNEDPAFKRNILLLGAYFWADTDNAELMEAKINQPWMADWSVTRMYEKNSSYWSTYDCDYPLLPANVMSVWPDGQYAFVNLAGHGSPTSTHIYGLGAPAFIQNSDCPQLNDDYPAIVFADACSNSDTDQLNLGQAMLKDGAVGFVGATKVALGHHGWDSAYDGSSQSLDYFFTTCVTSGEYSQGEALQWALTEMYVNGLWSYNKYETFEWGALWGNPDLWIGSPPVMTISFPDGIPEYVAPDTPTDLTVRIMDGTASYVPGTGQLYYRFDGGNWLSAPVVHQTADLYIATLPAAQCDDTPEFYISAETDGGTTVTNPYDAPAAVHTVIVGSFVKIADQTMDTDPGWTTEGQWAFGQPTGGGGEYGGPDPTSGHTGNKVYGYNLNGDYANSMSEYDLTTTSFDCSSVSNTTLKFRRWLGVEQSMYDHAYVRVSSNGTNWATIWQNSGTVSDSSWGEYEYDIASVADGESTVYLRWTMGTTDTAWRYCGWNIDDVEIWGLIECGSQQDPPTISTHPGSETRCEGESMTFTVEASGGLPLIYQWAHDGQNIPGANGPSFTMNPVGVDDAGAYRCVVSNAYGSAESDPAALTVVPLATCDDDDACTADTCSGGVCANTDDTPAGQCCDPTNGDYTSIDDDDVCTDDVCYADGSVTHDPNYDPQVDCCNPSNGDLMLIDDGNACTEDTCNADGSVDHDADYNPRLDCCDPATGDLTTINDGNDCTTDDTCDPATGEVTRLILTPSAAGGGARALMVTPQSCSGQVAVLVTSPDYPCVSMYVDADGMLVETPEMRTPTEWADVAIRGELIVPSSTYTIQCWASDVLSEAASATTWMWGDVDNDEDVDIDDILLIIQAFQSDFSQVTLEAADLHPCTPNGEIDIDDILSAIAGFQSKTYADTGCPIPCE